MIDRSGITKRFLSCFSDRTPLELAQFFEVTPPTVFQWLSGTRDVPWNRVKELADTQNISWDWLIEGHEPKSGNRKPQPKALPFAWHAINQRFLSLFPGLSQRKLGKILGVSQVSVYRWRHDKSNVPWEKLRGAAESMRLSWEWLLEGIEPKHRPEERKE